MIGGGLNAACPHGPFGGACVQAARGAWPRRRAGAPAPQPFSLGGPRAPSRSAPLPSVAPLVGARGFGRAVVGGLRPPPLFYRLAHGKIRRWATLAPSSLGQPSRGFFHAPANNGAFQNVLKKRAHATSSSSVTRFLKNILKLDSPTQKTLALFLWAVAHNPPTTLVCWLN